MDNILVINSSVSGDRSISRALVQEAESRLVLANPHIRVTHRDLAETPVPHLTPATVAGIRGDARTAAEAAARALSDEFIAEVQHADLLLIGAPMYNFSIPSSLRAWFDHVLRPRATFQYTTAGAEGLLNGKRAIVVVSRGGVYSEGPGRELDFQEPYVRALLAFIGITEASFIRAEKLGSGPEAQRLSLASARAQIAQIIDTDNDGAAASRDIEADPSTTCSVLLHKNLDHVFGERDAARRLSAIQQIYRADAVLHEPGRTAYGHRAISQAVTELLNHLPESFQFSAVRPASTHHGVGRLQWMAGPPGGPVQVTGTDVATFDADRIRSLHVFLDQKDK